MRCRVVFSLTFPRERLGVDRGADAQPRSGRGRSLSEPGGSASRVPLRWTGRIGTLLARASEPTPERNGCSSPSGERWPSGNQISMQPCSSAAAPSARLVSGLPEGSTGSTRMLRLSSRIQGRLNRMAVAPPQQVVRRRGHEHGQDRARIDGAEVVGVSRQAPVVGICSVPLGLQPQRPAQDLAHQGMQECREPAQRRRRRR